MSRREITLCDLGKPCDTRATGTCPLCGKDYCREHGRDSVVEIAIGLSPSPGWRGGKAHLATCTNCARAIEAVEKKLPQGYLASLLPSQEQIVEAVRALLAAETMAT